MIKALHGPAKQKETLLCPRAKGWRSPVINSEDSPGTKFLPITRTDEFLSIWDIFKLFSVLENKTKQNKKDKKQKKQQQSKLIVLWM